ncbi:MAG: DAK2 domain-containing protein [Planctomycetota bacterium]|jgi:dihydroxyacetone kinase-like protein|nr:DAK2 domain-containing protein [Planctomycetota bacterium]
MNSIDAGGALKILNSIASVMAAEKERLIGLDQVVGDGDLGLTMSAGFGGAAKDAATFGETEPGRLFMKAGMAINKYAPSTMGTLMATGFMRGGKAVAGKSELASADLAAFFQAFLDGLMERGKAKPGEKTVIDAVLPAAEAAKTVADMPLAEAFRTILAAAEKGTEDARALMSQHGKAAVFREKTQGLIDPGSMAFCLAVRGMADAAGAE